jgi:hypothetical protein
MSDQELRTKEQDAGGPCENTDRHLWPEVSDPNAETESIHVTAQGGIGINVGGYVYVKPLREWHRLAGGKEAMQPAAPRTDRNLCQALQFCLDMAEEEYPFQQNSPGGEICLRHIMRKCREALAAHHRGSP